MRYHLSQFLSSSFPPLGTKSREKSWSVMHRTKVYLNTALEKHSLPCPPPGEKGWTLNQALGGGRQAGCMECPKGWKINSAFWVMSGVAVFKTLTGLWVTVWRNFTALIRLKRATNHELENKTQSCLEAWLHARNWLVNWQHYQTLLPPFH